MRRKASGEQPLTEDEQKDVLADLMSASTREADRKLATHFPNQPESERTKPVSATITRIEFNASAELMKKFERLQAQYHHQTGGEWSKLFELLADREIEKLDAPRVSLAPRGAPPEHRARGMKQGRTRYVRKETHQSVWRNWERGCDHQLENGSRCASRRNLQKDHIHEFAFNGTNDRENLRLVCGPHNRYRSDQLEKLRRQFMDEIDKTRREFLRAVI